MSGMYLVFVILSILFGLLGIYFMLCTLDIIKILMDTKKGKEPKSFIPNPFVRFTKIGELLKRTKNTTTKAKMMTKCVSWIKISGIVDLVTGGLFLISALLTIVFYSLQSNMVTTAKTAHKIIDESNNKKSSVRASKDVDTTDIDNNGNYVDAVTPIGSDSSGADTSSGDDIGVPTPDIGEESGADETVEAESNDSSSRSQWDIPGAWDVTDFGIDPDSIIDKINE